MSRLPAEPPPRALAGPVRLGEAEELGLTRHELSTTRWQCFDRGVRVHHSLDAADPVVRIRALLTWLSPWASLGGWAALRCHGVRALDGRTGPDGATLLPILVHVGPDRHLRQRAGLVIDRSVLAPEDLTVVRGVRVTTATRAVFDVMCRDGAEDGVVGGDAAWARRVTSGPEVAAYVDARPRARGVPAARVAAAILSPFARSSPESRLRYVWVALAGLPGPEVNRGLAGRQAYFVGEPDLLDTDAGLVGEYDGSYHRSLAQQTADNAREEALERLNLTVVRATAVDMWLQRPRLVQRILDGYARGHARERTRDGWWLQVR